MLEELTMSNSGMMWRRGTGMELVLEFRRRTETSGWRG
jgi:hypothetical protein